MTEEANDRQANLKKILAEAEDLTDGRFSYVNNVRVSVNAHEIILDMYYLGPDTKLTPLDELPVRAQRLQRIVMPKLVAGEVAIIMGQLATQQVAEDQQNDKANE